MDMKEHLKEFDIKLTFDEISILTKRRFKQMVKMACCKKAFYYLSNEKNILSKGKEIIYSELKTQNYCQPGNGISTESMRSIFTTRS